MQIYRSTLDGFSLHSLTAPLENAWNETKRAASLASGGGIFGWITAPVTVAAAPVFGIYRSVTDNVIEMEVAKPVLKTAQKGLENKYAAPLLALVPGGQGLALASAAARAEKAKEEQRDKIYEAQKQREALLAENQRKAQIAAQAAYDAQVAHDVALQNSITGQVVDLLNAKTVADSQTPMDITPIVAGVGLLMLFMATRK